MARYIKNSQLKDRLAGKGIEYFEIRDTARAGDCTYVLRIDMVKAQPFIIGSFPTKAQPFGSGGQKRLFKQTVLQIGRKAFSPQYNLKRRGTDNKDRALVPLWVSNGTFFGDDCYDYLKTGSPPIDSSYFIGPIVDSTGLFDARWTNAAGRIIVEAAGTTAQGGPLIPAKKNRGVFLQKLSNGRVTIDFAQSSQSGAYWVEQGYSSVIGGAGVLIQNGILRNESYAEKPEGGNFLTYNKITKRYGGPTYCAGPVIAMNKTKKYLYIIQDHTHKNGEGNRAYDRQGRRWGQMAKYLGNELLAEINHQADGEIFHALVFDGGGSRGLWVRRSRFSGGIVDCFNNSEEENMNRRIVAHHFCIWGQVPGQVK